MKEYTIDAKNRTLGRVATEAAAILRGKNNPAFKANESPVVVVNVVNIKEIKITGQKEKSKKYAQYSGYPGGLRYSAMEEVLKKKGAEHVFRQAVLGMLPKNKLQNQMIKNLIIK